MGSKNRVTVIGELERRPTTAHDVARLAGVSQSAVSRVFTPGASVSPETRIKVMEAAKRLGYRPNQVARSLITRRSNIVGVAVPGTENPFYSAALDALSIALARIGYRVLLFSVDAIAGSDPILEEVLRYRVDALVLISTSLSSHFADECMQLGLPVVLLNRKTDSGLASSVTGDNLNGARMIAAFLLAGGHKRFAFVAGVEHSSTNRDREAGFLGYLSARKVRHIERRVGNYSTTGAEAAVRSLLELEKQPDAIFCANDHMALVAVNVAQVGFGLQPGRDISIVGFDNIDMAGWPLFGLTTYSQPIQTMVDQVISILERQLSGEAAVALQQLTEGELIVRTSARKPKTGLSRSGNEWVWCPRTELAVF
ncbi:LacI family DNA-binding transcriptional regulator [Trinickia mobilis]|uniref:LacI family DNA-binding transcriptional regulator n=1 Tax=Trinickia mobilis TaxID=2816356 RepID=UPI001A8E1B6A|nr:LacI family DNA-binding transcriptional regulator [Trinickia mobilis]